MNTFSLQPFVHQLHPDREDVNVDIQFENDQLIIQRNDASTILFRVCPIDLMERKRHFLG